VFETLVLARYTNLVVECERDLNLLSSEQSVIQPKWLYVLLSTALDVKTTDQTRKFIGDWILRSDLFSSRFPEGLAHFVSHSLLPWAMEGHLFIGSTKLHDGQTLSSRHGDRLSTFLCNLLVQTAPEKQSELLDAILDFLVRKHATLFAYSAVHLIRGISRAFETSDTLSLTKQQVENLLFISALRTLPEVATDYLVVQCSKICDLSESRTKDSLTSKLSELGQTRFHDLKAASDCVKQNVSNVQSEVIASPAKSQRDVKIMASVEKCKKTLQAMATDEPLSSAQLQNALEDIWSDVEFLEYPRALLVKLPAVFFSTAIYQVAYQDNNENDTGLRDLLVATLPRLLDLTQRRSFLLAPLVGSLRELVLSAPEAASILDLEECMLRICQSPPEPNIDLRMEYSTIPMLSELLNESANKCRDHYFGQGEGYGFAAYLDLISRMGSQHPELVQSLLEKLLARWKKQKVPTPTISAWKTTLQLEVMLLCFEQRSSEADEASLESMLKDLYFILSLEPLPRYRYLIEWTLARIQIAHPEFRAQTLEMLSTKDHQSNPKFLASLMKLGVMIATSESGTEDFAHSLATIFIALSSSSKIIVRHEAQWAFPQLMDHARAQKWDVVLSNPAHVSLDEYIRSLPRFGDPPAERVMSKIDPVADHTMTNLVEGPWTDLDYTRPPYTTHQDFVDLYASDTARETPNSQPASCMPLGAQIPKPPRPTTSSDEDLSPNKPLPGNNKPQEEETSIALQTKGTAYLKTSLDSEDPASSTNKKHNLLLVASLIENPYNLGGLSRVSEIFGARAMYVRDPKIVSEKDFTSVAVSSQHHIEIAPLPVAEISAWVAEKKSEGWTVVGIEQTDRSVLLGEADAVLPDKTILVLGSESLGMPAAVLGECDILVEIPQVGVTRSLNVQTAAAIVLFEYGRQHGKGK
jgi:tRNA guanosine-2'-O-methyltransferase